ncbi:MAG: class I SAM-dependent methyltransferase [Bacteroidota bacterium]
MGSPSLLPQSIAYFNYLIKAKNAYGLHSPFVYDLYQQVIKKSAQFRVDQVEELRKRLFQQRELIDVTDFKSNITKRKTVQSIAKGSLSRPKFSSFLLLMANYMEASAILETGTSFGVSTAYLACSNASSVISLEGSPVLSEMAKKNLRQLKLNKVKIITGDIHQQFLSAVERYQPDFVFLDADHRGTVTQKMIFDVIKYSPHVKCIVVHDIYWSKDMSNTWFQLTRDPRLRLTLDIFQAGIILPKRESPKQHFILHF